MYLKEKEKGIWEYNITNGTKVNSKGKTVRNQKKGTVKARNKTDAEKLVQVIEEEFIQQSKPQPQQDKGELTLVEFSKIWWPHVTSNTEGKTHTEYANYLEFSILPALGHLQLREITTEDIDNYTHSLTLDGVRRDGNTGGYSQKTIKNYKDLLNSILNQAVRWDYIEKNPCVNSKKIKYKPAQTKILEDTSIKLLLHTVKQYDLEHQTLLSMLVFTGARRSEIMGLQWGDINYNTKQFHFQRRSAAESGTGAYTKAGLKSQPERIVDIPQQLLKVLLEYKNSLEVVYSDDFVFPSPICPHTPQRPDAPTKWLCRFIERHELPKTTPHGIRHTVISLLIGAGMDPYTVANRHGHEIDVCLKVYTHLVKNNQREIVNKIDSMFS